MKILGYILVAIVLVVVGFLICYFGLGDQIIQLVSKINN